MPKTFVLIAFQSDDNCCVKIIIDLLLTLRYIYAYTYIYIYIPMYINAVIASKLIQKHNIVCSPHKCAPECQ